MRRSSGTGLPLQRAHARRRTESSTGVALPMMEKLLAKQGAPDINTVLVAGTAHGLTDEQSVARVKVMKGFARIRRPAHPVQCHRLRNERRLQ